MPWREHSVMEERLRFVARLLACDTENKRGPQAQRLTHIDETDLQRLIAAARACNDAACGPRLKIGSAHYEALHELSQTIRRTIIPLTAMSRHGFTGNRKGERVLPV